MKVFQKELLHHLLCPELGCGKLYPNKVQLNDHLLGEHQIEAFRCKVRGCTVSFASKIELSDHRKLSHSSLKSWPCGQCEATFATYIQLFSHHLLYHEAGHFGCLTDGCTFTGTTRIQVDRHRRTQRHTLVWQNGSTADEQGNTVKLGRPCSICAKKKVNFTVAINEDSSAGPNDDSTANCNGKRTTPMSGKLSPPKRTHAEPKVAEEKDDGEAKGAEEEGAEEEGAEEAVHLSVIVHHLKCTETGCKTKCTDKDQLNMHLLAKHKIKMYGCKVKGCTQSFAKWGELTDHRKWAHRKLKNWPCAQCETTFKSYRKQSAHYWRYHEEGEFHCSADKCDVTGKTRIEVYSHQYNHGSAKFKCTLAHCTASFKRKSTLTIHLRAHTQERPFACEQCPKAFTTKGELTVHERTHSGLKPYHCKWPGCEHSASHRSNVNTHVRTLHFGLPGTKKGQTGQRIIDTRDVGEFVGRMATN